MESQDISNIVIAILSLSMAFLMMLKKKYKWRFQFFFLSLITSIINISFLGYVYVTLDKISDTYIIELPMQEPYIYLHYSTLVLNPIYFLVLLLFIIINRKQWKFRQKKKM